MIFMYNGGVMTEQLDLNKKYLKKSEYWSFGMAGFGQNMIYMTMSTYLMVFYTEVALVPAGIVTAMFLIARIWDAINDSIMGALVDRVNPDKNRFKSKFKPFLLITPFFMALFTILCFVVPVKDYQHAEAWQKVMMVVYMYVTYIGWGMVYTIADVPFWGSASVTTPNEKERANFISIARIFCTIGSLVPMVALPLVEAITKDISEGGNVTIKRTQFLVIAIMMAVVGAGLFLAVGIGSKERVKVEPTPTKFIDNFKMLKDNKPLLLIILAGIIGAGRLMAQVGVTYVATYTFYGDVTLFGFLKIAGADTGTKTTLLNVGLGAGLGIGTFIAPILQNKMDFKKLYIGSSLIGGILSAISFVIFLIVGNGGDPSRVNANASIAVITTLLSSVSLGIYNVLTYNMIADTVDYLEFQTGERKEGMCFSFQTFMTKFAAGVASLIGGLLIIPELTGFKVVENNLFQDQTWTVKVILFAEISLIPAIGSLIAIIPMKFYDYIGEKKNNILAELEKRREEKGEILENAPSIVEMMEKPSSEA